MAHPRLLRDIFKTCVPRPRGRSAPVPVPRAAPAASIPPFCRPSASASVRFQPAHLGDKLKRTLPSLTWFTFCGRAPSIQLSDEPI